VQQIWQSVKDMPEWIECGQVLRFAKDGELLLSREADETPGSEQGISTSRAITDVELHFDLFMSEDAQFIAKLRQQHQTDQLTNSYHCFCHPHVTYVARHNTIIAHLSVSRGSWQKVLFRASGSSIELFINDERRVHAKDGLLRTGYCFLGVKAGTVRLKNIRLTDLGNSLGQRKFASGLLMRYPFSQPFDPKVSIITTVYDRVNCLRECIKSVQAVHFQDYEHIIVSDHPPEEVSKDIEAVVRQDDNSRICYADLDHRYNNWGIAPASTGLKLARGNYVCFLSDDNGYLPNHFDKLVELLDRDRSLGFVYSSCQYAGRTVLRYSTPRPGRIDLGQPLFRRELFDRHLGGTLPFKLLGWDWSMIEAFMLGGENWHHIDEATFLFRLAACGSVRK
jgi:hypothetical protein